MPTRQLIDAYQLAQLVVSYDASLKITEGASGFACVICGAVQEPYAWRVRLPARAGVACPNCAADAGFTVA